eukprot:TRINITY_DN14965_c0_g1_i2.p1 TRINITY_DN14965_c0_g1~~TRINITY_DN14965_c0_g1_i2.p1  ORF type:complete len:275 (+),score=51.06 TRINITY_DN14965_c0_g1_i2:38-826(+)
MSDSSPSQPYFDIVNRVIHTKKDDNLILHTSGGILADSMGLGKTITVLGLIIANPPKRREVQKIEKFITNAPNNNGAADLGQIFDSRATLVICPNHLVAQWQDEIKTATSPPLRVAIITTASQHREVTYRDLMVELDVVVVSFQYLKNGSCQTLDAYLGSQSRSSRRRPQIVTLEDTLKQRQPIIEKIRWHRIVLDEAHEATRRTAKPHINELMNINASYRYMFCFFIFYYFNSLNNIFLFFLDGMLAVLLSLMACLVCMLL